MKRFAMGWLPGRVEFRCLSTAASDAAQKLKSASFLKTARSIAGGHCCMRIRRNGGVRPEGYG